MVERSSINERRVPRVNGVKDDSLDLVISADGTTIGVRRFGRGPGLVLLHGGVNAAKHMMRLGERLADAYTIYLPDRRGRGTSGPYGSRYCIDREDEDLAAVIDHSGAEFVFGPADRGLFALHGSIGIERVRRVAHQGHFPTWLAAVLRHLPPAATGRLIDLLLRLEPARSDGVSWRRLLDALLPELDLVLSTAGMLEQFRRLEADALLMYGTRTDSMFVTTAAELHRVLPSSTVMPLPGLNHDSTQNYGRPAAIADALRGFFTP